MEPSVRGKWRPVSRELPRAQPQSSFLCRCCLLHVQEEFNPPMACGSLDNLLPRVSASTSGQGPGDRTCFSINFNYTCPLLWPGSLGATLVSIQDHHNEPFHSSPQVGSLLPSWVSHWLNILVLWLPCPSPGLNLSLSGSWALSVGAEIPWEALRIENFPGLSFPNTELTLQY